MLEAIRAVLAAWPANRVLVVHAEDRTVALVLGLLAERPRRVHFAHVSQAVEIALIRDAKERGLPVTCEVAPHHLYLTAADVPRLGGFGVMKPPLRTSQDVDALWANLAVVLLAGIALNAGGAVGAGDAKFAAAAAPFVAAGDAADMALILAAALLVAWAAHRLARATVGPALRPDWRSWTSGKRFPMGVALAGALLAYLALAATA